MTADEQALLAAVIAAPDDSLPRLVYADWLEEHGRVRQAQVMRHATFRVGGDPAAYLRITVRYPELTDRLVYLWGATGDLLNVVRHGVVFFMAWWSGPALAAFKAVTDALRSEDPAGEVMLVVVDIDGITTEFDQFFRPLSVQMTGVGEALWLSEGRLFQATRVATPANGLRALVRELVAARRPDVEGSP